MGEVLRHELIGWVLGTAGGLALGYWGLKRPRRVLMVKVGDPDPAKRCPMCHGCGQSLVAGAVTTAACEAAQHLSPPENKR